MKRALITGAARRIGREIALELAAAGLDIVLHVRRFDADSQDLAGRIRAAGRQAFVMEADLADAAGLVDAFDRTVATHGPVDMLVNNAAIFRHDRLDGFDPVVLRAHVAVNLEAPLLLARGLQATLPADATGLIVNIIDERIGAPTGQFLSYDISKAGLWTATRALARDLAPRIRVNAVAPGLVIPPGDGSDHGFDARVGSTPLGVRTDPQEIARAVRFIMESPSMTGTRILIDSGRHLRPR